MNDLIQDYWSSPSSERPYLGPDMTYDKQRKLRMQDAIDDYLQDPDVDARRCYEEMLSCVEDVIKYHKKELNKASELYNLMLGNRRYDMNKPAKPASVGSTTNNEDGTKSYGYAASVTMSDIHKFQRGNSL